MKEVKRYIQIKKPLLLVVVALMISTSVPVFAKAYIQVWDLVDSGKHLDYDGNSSYMSYITTGASTWNAYKSGVIRPDSLSVIEDVYVCDINVANGWAGMTYSNGYVKI